MPCRSADCLPSLPTEIEASRIVPPPVTREDFLKSLRTTRPTVSEEDLLLHVKFTQAHAVCLVSWPSRQGGQPLLPFLMIFCLLLHFLYYFCVFLCFCICCVFFHFGKHFVFSASFAFSVSHLSTGQLCAPSPHFLPSFLLAFCLEMAHTSFGPAFPFPRRG